MVFLYFDRFHVRKLAPSSVVFGRGKWFLKGSIEGQGYEGKMAHGFGGSHVFAWET